MRAGGAAGVLVWVVCGAASAQQLLQVENAASLLTGDVAAGSLVKLQLIYQGGPVTPIDPATVSAQLLPMGSQDPLPLSRLEVLDATSVLVLIPSATPLGPVSIALNYNGQSVTQNVTIVATSFGLYSAGLGEAALAQNITSNGLQLNNLTHPAHPQDFVTLWGTGLGAATADHISVLMGGHPFPVAYAGPSGEFAGLDQINFQVPDDPAIPQGCYVAVNIQIGNSISNLATLSVSRDAGPCVHPFGLTADELAQLDSGGQIYVGQIDLYSTIGGPPDSLFSPAYVRMESANAQFHTYDAGILSIISQPLFADDYLAGCTRAGVGASAGLFALIFNPLNMGKEITIQGPAGQVLNLLPPGDGPPSLYNGSEPAGHAVSSPDQLPAPFFSAGQWQANAPGNSNVQPFTAMLSIPNPIQVTNYSQLTTVDHAQDLTIAWDPTTYSSADFVTVQLYPQVPSGLYVSSSIVLCRVHATAGHATIPAALLASFQPSAMATLSLSSGRKPGTAALFTVGLSDGTSIPSAFQYHSLEVILVQFQ
ncbi:MAG TPA: hypothetical protein VNX70_17640 [Bryobacteraceae bacterium]|nr:hypothetical protein [Bryobacteraceae bacterium]